MTVVLGLLQSLPLSTCLQRSTLQASLIGTEDLYNQNANNL